jgi:hypothetical protein
VSWQDRVITQVRATHTRQKQSVRTPFGPDNRPLQFACTRQFMVYVVAAAEAMGVNRSTYVRRVIAVHAAHVLGIDVRTILFESPKARAFGAGPMRRDLTMGARDDGDGIEGWCPHPGCEGDHLSRDSGK